MKVRELCAVFLPWGRSFEVLGSVRLHWYVHPSSIPPPFPLTPPAPFHPSDPSLISSFSMQFLPQTVSQSSKSEVVGLCLECTCQDINTACLRVNNCWVCVLRVTSMFGLQVVSGPEPGGLLSARLKKRQVTSQPVKSTARKLQRAITGYISW